jgi:hypothetical protein
MITPGGHLGSFVTTSRAPPRIALPVKNRSVIHRSVSPGHRYLRAPLTAR